MSFFPVTLWSLESHCTLWIVDSLEILQAPSSEEFLHAFVNLLNKIERAVVQRFSIALLSDRFNQSTFRPIHFSISHPAPSELLVWQAMINFAQYIQDFAARTYPELFTDTSSLASQVLSRTITTLQSLISLQPLPHYAIPEMNIQRTAISYPLPPLLPSTSQTTLWQTSISLPSTSDQQHPFSESSDEYIDVENLSPSHSLPTTPQTTLWQTPFPSPNRKRSFSESSDECIDVENFSSPDSITAPPIKIYKPAIQDPSNTAYMTPQISDNTRPSSSLEHPFPCDNLPSPSVLEALASDESDHEEKDERTEEQPFIDLSSIMRRSNTPIQATTSIITPLPARAGTEMPLLPAKRLLPESKIPSSNLFFVSLRFSNDDTTFSLFPRQHLYKSREMMLFLKDIRKAINCVAYTCLQPIPEIKVSQSSNKALLLQTLYACVVRSHFYFNANLTKPVLKVNQEIHKILITINSLYCNQDDLDDIEDENPSCHHSHLRAYEINPLSPPAPIIMQPKLLYISLKPSPKKTASIRVNADLIGFQNSSPEETLCAFGSALQYTLLKCANFMHKGHLFIEGNDPNYILDHPQKSPLSLIQAKEIFNKILSTNQSQLKNYLASLPPDIRLYRSIQIAEKNINELFKDLEKMLLSWTNTPLATCLEKVTSTTKTSHTTKKTSHKIKKIDPPFPSIVYYKHRNSFSIQEGMSQPNIRYFSSLLSTILMAKKSISYSCTTAVTDIKTVSSNDPKTILCTLFTIVCRYTFLYQNSRTIQGLLRYISPEILKKITSTLQALNEDYCQISPLNENVVILPYHPDLQSIINLYSLNQISTNVSEVPFLTFCNINVNPLLKTLEITTSSIYEALPSKVLLQAAKNLKTICTDLIQISHLPSDSVFHITSPDGSYTPEEISLNTDNPFNTTLLECQKILKKIRKSILLNPSLTSGIGLTGHNSIKLYIKTTLSFLKAASTNAPLPSSRPEALIPLVDLSLFYFSHNYTGVKCFLKKFYSHFDNRHLAPIRTSTTITSKQIIAFINNQIPYKASVFYENKRTKEKILVEKNEKGHITMIPLFVTGLKQNRLLIQQMIHSNKFRKPSEIVLRSCITTIDETLTILQNKWSSLQQRYQIPDLGLFPTHFQDHLLLSEAEMQQIQETINHPLEQPPVEEAITFESSSDSEQERSVSDSTDS